MITQEQIDRFNQVCYAAFEKSDADCGAVLDGNETVLLRLRTEAGLSKEEMYDVIWHNSKPLLPSIQKREEQWKKVEEDLQLSGEELEIHLASQKLEDIKPGDWVMLKPSLNPRLVILDPELIIAMI